MSTPAAPTSAVYRWYGGRLEPLEYCDMTETTVEAADSWFVTGGRVLAIGLHRDRFLDAVGTRAPSVEAFWEAALALVPGEGDWFPRVELQSRAGSPLLVFRLRSAPTLTRSVVLATYDGPDPRTRPSVKGPDLEAMLRVRTAVQPLGAEEAVILSPNGYVVEGAYSALVWWRGSILCSVAPEFPRVASVTERSLVGLATALGVETYAEAVTPAELDGTELWSLGALHGPRIVTRWVEGPQTAELPGRLELWRTRRAALRRPLA